MALTEIAGKYEDVFDDEGDMQIVDEIAWKKLKEARMKDGFADGKYLGEESTLQNGFDHGYAEGFEVSHPISIIQGLLAVVEMQITNSQSLMKRSKEIKTMLDVFRENVKSFKLSCLHEDKSVDSDDELVDCEDENSNSYVSEENSSHTECYFSSLNKRAVFEKNNAKVMDILEDFNKLKEEISRFISDCNQPAVMKKISMIYDQWGIQHITRFSSCETECTCVNESTRTSCLPAKT